MNKINILLKQNNKVIIDKLKASDIRVCICAEFNESVWIHYSTLTNSVHGIGYPIECYPDATPDEMCKYYLGESTCDIIECKDIDEFINQIKKYQENEMHTQS